MGSIYVVIFGFPVLKSNIRLPNTPKQKVVALRTALVGVSVSTSQLANLKQNDVVSDYALGQMQSQIQTSTADLRLALQRAPSEVPDNAREQIGSILDQQDKLASQYKTISPVLGHVISYDPSSDLNLTDQDDKLATRATAASDGLNKALRQASDPPKKEGGLEVGSKGNVSLLNAQTQKQLQAEISCFSQLAEQVKAKSAGTQQTKSRCLTDYPTLRGLAVSNTLEQSYNQEASRQLSRQVVTLVKALDGLSSKTKN